MQNDDDARLGDTLLALANAHTDLVQANLDGNVKPYSPALLSISKRLRSAADTLDRIREPIHDWRA